MSMAMPMVRRACDAHGDGCFCSLAHLVARDHRLLSLVALPQTSVVGRSAIRPTSSLAPMYAHILLWGSLCIVCGLSVCTHVYVRCCYRGILPCTRHEFVHSTVSGLWSLVCDFFRLFLTGCTRAC